MKQIKKTFLAVCAAGSTIMDATSAKANLVIDGNFNSNGESNPGLFTTITAGNNIGNNSLGWTVTAGSVDLIGSLWNAPTAGGNSVDMAGNSSGTIQQTVNNLVVGQEYELTFALSGNPDGSPSTKELVSFLGATTDTFYYTTSINNQSSIVYQTQTAFFKATSASEVLRFQDQSFNFNNGNSTPYGAVIGDVSLTAVPETSTIAAGALMLLPLGVSALRIMRKNQLA